MRYDLRQNRTLLLMAAPGLLLLLVFSYLPMLGLVLAFKDYRFSKGILGSEWVGLDNFRFLLQTSDAWRITHHTLLLNGLFIVATTVAAVGVALLLDELRRSLLIKFYRFTLFIPYFLSWVIVGWLALVVLHHFPFLRGDAALLTFYGPVMRKDWLDTLGMAPPTTIDEWHAALTAMKGNDPNGSGSADEWPFLP